jgi:hypothetical protein
MINASFDILMVLFVVWYWVETKGMTLEEVDVKFDGVKHSNVPDLNAFTRGNADLRFVEELKKPGLVGLDVDDKEIAG